MFVSYGKYIIRINFNYFPNELWVFSSKEITVQCQTNYLNFDITQKLPTFAMFWNLCHQLLHSIRLIYDKISLDYCNGQIS